MYIVHSFLPLLGRWGGVSRKLREFSFLPELDILTSPLNKTLDSYTYSPISNVCCFSHDILIFLTGQEEIESAVRSMKLIAKDLPTGLFKFCLLFKSYT